MTLTSAVLSSDGSEILTMVGSGKSETERTGTMRINHSFKAFHWEGEKRKA